MPPTRLQATDAAHDRLPDSGTDAGSGATPVTIDVSASASPTSPQTASRFAGRRIHLVGIGGCGLSGLARMLQALGAQCTGSDAVESTITRDLAARGIGVAIEPGEESLPDGCDWLIVSAAVPPEHPSRQAAAAANVPVLTYAEALGRLQAERTGVSIAGTHGKSTTTAMLAHTLAECGLDPSVIVGATCNQLGGGFRMGAERIPAGPRAGDPGLLLVEACEFNRSFHHHRPALALVNNVEEDHLDVYGSLDEIVRAFADFVQLLPSADDGGELLVAHEGAHRREITAAATCRVTTFGFSPAADYQVITDPSVRRVGVLADGMWLAQWTNALPGEHNALNAAAAAILAARLGADWDRIAEALSGFRGLDRRMQRLGRRPVTGGSAVVYDDYGHHPTEIEKTLRALRTAERPQRLVCVFQPHQHSRTRFLLDEFAQSFSSADVVIVPEIYFVRDSELERHRVSAADLVDRLRARGVTAMHLHPFDAIVEQLELMARDGDLVVIMGAGPVWKVGAKFFENGRAAEPAIDETIAGD